MAKYTKKQILGIVASAARGIIFFLAAIAFTYGFMHKAHADEGKWFAFMETYLYLDYEVSDHRYYWDPETLGTHEWVKGGTFCMNQSSMTSNLGVTVNVYKRGPFEFNTHLAHHSCAFGPDLPDYNALGAGIVYRFERQ